MHVITINNQTFKGPDGWDKLSCAGLLQYAQVLQCAALSEKQAKHQIVMRLFNIPVKIFKILPESRRILLHQYIAWIFEKNTLVSWLIKMVVIDKVRLFGPNDKLKDLTGEEFMFCEAAYERWLQTGDAGLMDTLFAVLYRKKGFFSGKRTAFDRDRLQAAEKRAKKVKTFVKRAVMINYAGFRNLLIQCHPHVWRQAASNTEASGQQVTGWAGIFLELAGDKFGTYPETIKTNLWLLLADLDKKAKTAQEMEANS